MFTACPESPNEDERDTTIYLELEDTGIFTARMRVGVADTTDDWTFGLSRNDSIVLTATVTALDTVLRDSGLTPATEYRYRAYWLEDGIAVDSSLEITAITGDTTSHAFTWVLDTLGESGVLHDVWAFDENNVWVVGEILPVASETWNSYGAAVWDGEQWTLKKLEDGATNVRPRGVWAFSEEDIWFAAGSIFHWDGNEVSFEWVLPDINHGVYSLWGESFSNIYFVGDNGTIVHYDGSSFTKMESGTDLDLWYVTGSVDDYGEVRVWAGSPQRILLFYDEESWMAVWDEAHPFYADSQYTSTRGIWAPDNETLIVSVVGNNERVYCHNQIDFADYHLLSEQNEKYTFNIGGRAKNDFFMVGEFWTVYHYNGNSTFQYDEISGFGRFRSVSQVGSNAFAVGEIFGIFGGPFVARGVR